MITWCAFTTEKIGVTSEMTGKQRAVFLMYDIKARAAVPHHPHFFFSTVSIALILTFVPAYFDDLYVLYTCAVHLLHLVIFTL